MQIGDFVCSSDQQVAKTTAETSGPSSNMKLELSNSVANQLDQLVGNIQDSVSPYLNLRQSNLALATLQLKPLEAPPERKLRPTELAILNGLRNVAHRKYMKNMYRQQARNSIFKRRESPQMDFFDKTEAALVPPAPAPGRARRRRPTTGWAATLGRTRPRRPAASRRGAPCPN
ncbi:hypothetical protein ACJJTC_017225 [Scirpophaga incertulas]